MRTSSYRTRLALFLAIGTFLAIGFVWGRSVILRHPPAAALKLSILPAQLLADGHDIATLRIDAPSPHDGPAKISVTEGLHRVSIEELHETAHGWFARVRAATLPGRVTLRVEAPGFLPATAELSTTLQTTDRASDGTPDFLRLDEIHDKQAFRRWFTFLAEAQFFQPPSQRPAEIDDCAALIRYAYREALRAHDNAWAAAAHLPLIPALDSIEKFEYPYTPLGPAVFRVRPGPFDASDVTSGAFAQFADVKTLASFNTQFVTRDLAHAAPGDLLFFRQLSEHMPFHSMIYIGKSAIGPGDAKFVIYHTGPSGRDPGEIRRLTIDELLHFPEPQWRPVPANPSFLGVYRWNILRSEI